MSLLRLQNIHLGFGGPDLLAGLDFNIEDGERICLIGRNGAGKSTLLKVIQGIHPVDSGDKTLKSGVLIATLEQEVPETIQDTVFNVVASGLDDIGSLLSRYHDLIQHGNTEDPDWFDQLEKTQQLIEQKDGWKLQQQVESIISRLSLPADSHFTSLSGGMRRRVLLAKALVLQPNILLLDEPTNHLDIESIQWLEEFLLTFKGAILFITHDRTFLKNMATRLVELDRGKVSSYPGDYENYLRRKEERRHDEMIHNARFDKKLAQEEAWIRKGIKARRTRNEGRVRALKQLRAERSQRRNLQGNANLKLETAEKSGKLVIEAKNIVFSYGDDKNNIPIVKNFSTVIQRGDKVGLLGPNGVGKTTLLKILLGKLKPTSGSIKIGTKFELAYFDQLRAQLDLEKTVIDNLDIGSDQVIVNGVSKHVISYLQDFLFTPDRIRSPVKTLSGGERNRLLLAKLFLKPANVLVMDEPTNDLDIETLELLEELLLNYQGTLLLVSHDRSFINNIVTSCIAFEGNANVNEYVGGYDDWLRQRSSSTFDSKKKASQKSPTKTKKISHTSQKNTPSKKITKLSYNEQRELEQLPEIIENYEAALNILHDKMASVNFYNSAADAITKTQNEVANIQKKLDLAYERWEFLEN